VCVREAHLNEQSGEPAHIDDTTGDAAQVADPQPATGTWECQIGETGLIRECSLLGGLYPGGGERSSLQHFSSLQGALATRAPTSGTYTTDTYLTRGPLAGSGLGQGSTSHKLHTGVCGRVHGQPVSLGGSGARHTSKARKLRVPQGVRRCPSVFLWRHHRVSRRKQLHQHQLVSQ
jgi:hypothetical protein